MQDAPVGWLAALVKRRQLDVQGSAFSLCGASKLTCNDTGTSNGYSAELD